MLRTATKETNVKPTANATYRNDGTKAEAFGIVFDPPNYRKLLEFLLQIHDPITVNLQGNDRGTSDRSAIFYTSEEQRQIANDTIADVYASVLWPGRRVLKQLRLIRAERLSRSTGNTIPMVASVTPLDSMEASDPRGSAASRLKELRTRSETRTKPVHTETRFALFS
jgi:hypothetical protein